MMARVDQALAVRLLADVIWTRPQRRGKGSFDRIYNVFFNAQRTTPALTTAQSFASYYDQTCGGAAEQLSGRTVRSSYTIPLRSQTAAVAPRRLGTTVVDAHGERVVSMTAVER